jgi:hypothetical protein
VALERYNRHDDQIEDMLKMATVFNVFYSFDPVYYARKDLAPKTASMHRTYIRIWQELYKAGWEPVTLARASAEDIMLERYGAAGRDRLFVAYNKADREQSFVLSFDKNPELGPVTQVKEILGAGGSRSVRESEGFYSFELTLGPKQIAVLRVL